MIPAHGRSARRAGHAQRTRHPRGRPAPRNGLLMRLRRAWIWSQAAPNAVLCMHNSAVQALQLRSADQRTDSCNAPAPAPHGMELMQPSSSGWQPLRRQCCRRPAALWTPSCSSSSLLSPGLVGALCSSTALLLNPNKVQGYETALARTASACGIAALLTSVRIAKVRLARWTSRCGHCLLWKRCGF